MPHLLLKSRLLSGAALAAGGWLAAGAALAQDASANASQSVEQVVVTGSRAVIASPAQVKRSETTIVDTITAKQLDRLPDQSLAEALDRVVGVSSDVGYNSAQARTVTLRGFDARYDSMEVDGNPIWNASRNNRGTQLDVFPAAAVSQVNVYKVVTPDQDANSIGGHIELRTLRAFDGGGQPYFSMKAEAGGYEHPGGYRGSRPSYLVSMVGKRTFGPDGRYGFVLGADLQQDNLRDTYNTATGYSQINNVDVVNGSLFKGAIQESIYRTALYGKLETHATDKLYAFLFASYFRERNDENYYRTGVFLTGSKVTNAAEGSGSFTNSADEAYLETYNLDRKTILLGSGADYRLGDRGTVNFRASYTNYNHHELDATGERFEAPAVSGSYSLGDDSGDVSLASNSSLGDSANWTYRNKKASQLKYLPDVDNVYSAKLDYSFNNFAAARGFGFGSGLFWRRLNRSFNQTVYNYTLPQGVSLNLASLGASGNLDGSTAVQFNAPLFWSTVESKGTLTIDPSLTADYNLVEDVYAGHAEGTWAWDRLRLTAGARVEATRSTDRTGSNVNGVVVPMVSKIDYTNILPNIQAQFDATSRLRLRMAYTETIARPDFSDFAMGRTVSTDANGNPVISGTNPYLKPRESKNYDTSLEYYYTGGYASAAVFHKDMVNEEFSQLTQQTNAAGEVVQSETEPLNSGSAHVTGLELSLGQDRFTWLPHPLDGLYANGNYTLLNGIWNVVFSNGSRRSVAGLRNQPHWLGNLTGGYAIGGLDVSVSARFRGKTFTGTFGTTAAGDVWYEDYTRVDMQASYRIGNDLTLFAEARNLNDAFLKQTTGLHGALTSAVNPGRSVFMGIKFRPR